MPFLYISFFFASTQVNSTIESENYAIRPNAVYKSPMTKPYTLAIVESLVLMLIKPRKSSNK